MATDDEERAVFREAMRGVKPLPAGAPKPRDRPPPDANRQARRQAALGLPAAGSGLVVSDYAEACAPDAVLAWCGPGVQQRLFKRLRNGQLAPEATLDLHGQRLQEAAASVPAFIEQAGCQDWRVVRIIHGKGGRDQSRQAPLKSQLPGWLRQLDAVLAYHSAPAADGGAGALYVLLRRRRGGTDRMADAS